jgi:phosphopantothenoylcysteine decarboxylase/phosphopantothenate--cysteine ligase
MPKQKEIIIGITGSIAAYKAAEIIRFLKKKNFLLTAIMTDEATKFITPLTIQTVSGNKVYQNMFELPEKWDLVHTSLADKADLILIAPATANIIGKLANGICDDLLTCTVFASKAKVLIAPAMNNKMYEHKIVQDNIKKLKNLGYKFIDPVRGRLACGEEAIGCLARVEDIVLEVKKLL